VRSFSFGDFVFLLLAIRWTLVLSAGAFVFGGLIGAGVALARVSNRRPLRQLFLVFFGGDLIGLDLGPYLSAILGLSLNAGAFLGEIWRGALQAVPSGQTEAARALGLRYRACMLRVVGPQALRIAIPPTVGYLVNLVKSTSLAAIIGFVELTRAGQMINNATFQPFKIFGIVAALYFLLCWPLTIVSRRLEARLTLAGR
jgi:polar amino acid transport system permease protein